MWINLDEFQSMIERAAICEEILAELESGTLILPTLPEVALRVNDTADNPDVCIGDLADVVSTDAALAVQLVKVANSPLYRGRYPVDNVHTALSRLGLKMARNIISSLFVEQMFNAPSPELEIRLKEVWHHSVDVAATSHVLASMQPQISRDEAMLAGLIHDIGALPILMKAEKWPELFANESMLNGIISELSAEIGVSILERWNFSSALVAVVAERENYHRQSTGDADLVDVIQVANLQSHHNRLQFSEAELAEIPAFKKLGIQSGVQVVDLDENSSEYAEAMALFGA